MAYYRVTVRDGVDGQRHDFDKKCVKVDDTTHGCLSFFDAKNRCLALIPLANISGVYLIDD